MSRINIDARRRQRPQCRPDAHAKNVLFSLNRSWKRRSPKNNQCSTMRHLLCSWKISISPPLTKISRTWVSPSRQDVALFIVHLALISISRPLDSVVPMWRRRRISNIQVNCCPWVMVLSNILRRSYSMKLWSSCNTPNCKIISSNWNAPNARWSPRRFREGRKLGLLFSPDSQPSNSTKRKRQTEKEQQTSKILVKNIPFQANARELRELFRVFGELKFVRMPKKIDDEHHRGFGFVDFMSKNDAKVERPPHFTFSDRSIFPFLERFRSSLSQYTFVRTAPRPRMGRWRKRDGRWVETKDCRRIRSVARAVNRNRHALRLFARFEFIG